MAGMQQEAATALASMTLLTPPSPMDSPKLLWEPSRLLSHIRNLLLTAQQKVYSGHELTLRCTAAMTPHYPGGIIPAREGFLLAMLRSPFPVASGVWLRTHL